MLRLFIAFSAAINILWAIFLAPISIWAWVSAINDNLPIWHAVVIVLLAIFFLISPAIALFYLIKGNLKISSFAAFIPAAVMIWMVSGHMMHNG